MPRNPNLVATPVTDKNGVTTTRWKRPAPPAAGRAFAPPVLSAAPDPWTDKKDAQREVDEALERDGLVMGTVVLDVLQMGQYNREWREAFKSGIKPETLRILDDRFQGKYSSIIPFVKECAAQRSPASLNNAALFIDLLDKCHEKYGDDPGIKDDGNDMFGRFIFGLQWHHRANHKDFSSSPQDKEQGEALLRALTTLGIPYRQYAVERDSYSVYYLPSRELAGLITKRPKDVERIVGILRERRLPAMTAEDVTHIESLMDGSGSSALVNGSL